MIMRPQWPYYKAFLTIKPVISSARFFFENSLNLASEFKIQDSKWKYESVIEKNITDSRKAKPVSTIVQL